MEAWGVSPHTTPGGLQSDLPVVISRNETWYNQPWLPQTLVLGLRTGPGGGTMRLEDYFDFLAPDDIRLKGHRIGIDDVLYYYLDGYTPEEIAANLPTLSLEQIHATITY